MCAARPFEIHVSSTFHYLNNSMFVTWKLLFVATTTTPVPITTPAGQIAPPHSDGKFNIFLFYLLVAWPTVFCVIVL